MDVKITNWTLIGKAYLYALIFAVGVLIAYSINDVWKYPSFFKFLFEYQFIAYPLLVMLVRVITATRIQGLAIWLSITLILAGLLSYSKIYGHRASEAVWMFGIEFLFLSICALISLRLGNIDKKSV
ncbi:MAG: hypothetical protein GY931_19220 [Maribacter sp.]|nr:hypothetical protein [Maribacter sp.]